jgi:Gpi18-like mannosyltransferase
MACGLKWQDWTWIAGTLAAIACAYLIVWPGVTGDMTLYLIDWFETIVANGQLGAFGRPFANYTPPYLYLLSATTLLDGVVPTITLIKMLSVLGTAALAAAVHHLLRAVGVEKPWKPALWMCLLPSVVLNGPGFGQCDAMWSAACVMAVTEAIRRRHMAMLIWCGVAVAFKAQAIFIAPFVLVHLLTARVPLRLWPIPALTFAAAMLPAWLLGWPASDLATIYFRQAEWMENFVSSASNPWALVQYYAPVAGWNLRWIGFVAAGIATAAYVALLRGRTWTPAALIAAALLSALMVPWLLPKMHERFFFLADILAFALAFAMRNRRGVAIVVLVQASSVLALLGLMLGLPWPQMAGCGLVGAAIALTIAELISGDQRTRLTNILPSRSSVRNSGRVAIRSLNLAKP